MTLKTKTQVLLVRRKGEWMGSWQQHCFHKMGTCWGRRDVRGLFTPAFVYGDAEWRVGKGRDGAEQTQTKHRISDSPPLHTSSLHVFSPRVRRGLWSEVEILPFHHCLLPYPLHNVCPCFPAAHSAGLHFVRELLFFLTISTIFKQTVQCH